MRHYYIRREIHKCVELLLTPNSYIDCVVSIYYLIIFLFESRQNSFLFSSINNVILREENQEQDHKQDHRKHTTAAAAADANN